MKLPAMFLMATLCLFTACNKRIRSVTAPVDLLPKADIEACLKEYLGLPRQFEIQSTEWVSLGELDVPFLTKSIQDKTGLRVVLTPSIIPWKELPGHPASAQPHPVRTFTVVMDSKAKDVLYVTSFLTSEGRQKKERIPTGKIEGEGLRGPGAYNWAWVGSPKITLLEALDIMREHGSAYPSRAAEIDAMYVLFSHPDFGKFPAWVVETRGGRRMEISFTIIFQVEM